MNTKRIFKDIIAYKNSKLHEQGIYCEFNETNINEVKIMITGNKNTPYENGFYLFILLFPPNYPFDPPTVKFYTNGKKIRFNPNLYTNGKVCLSILNTWNGPGWTSACSLISVLLSLSSILTENPIQNEPGWNAVLETDRRAIEYNMIIKYSNLEIAIIDNIVHTSSLFRCFKDIMIESCTKNKKIIIENIRSFNSINNTIIKTSIYNLSIKINTTMCIKELNKIVKHTYKRQAPNKKSNDLDVGYEYISENNNKLYYIHLTKTNKKMWKLKINK